MSGSYFKERLGELVIAEVRQAIQAEIEDYKIARIEQEVARIKNAVFKGVLEKLKNAGLEISEKDEQRIKVLEASYKASTERYSDSIKSLKAAAVDAIKKIDTRGLSPEQASPYVIGNGFMGEVECDCLFSNEIQSRVAESMHHMFNGLLNSVERPANGMTQGLSLVEGSLARDARMINAARGRAS